MSASSDCKIAIYDLQGNLLKQVEPKLNKLHSAVVSPCGRFVAASGFTPDVLVWEVRQARFSLLSLSPLLNQISGFFRFNLIARGPSKA
jgi:tricorn protease-like protein